jgi:hypothetical protein
VVVSLLEKSNITSSEIILHDDAVFGIVGATEEAIKFKKA